MITKEKDYERIKAYKKAHPDKVKKWHRTYYLKNKEKIKDRSTSWNKNNKESRAAILHKYDTNVKPLVYRWISPKGFTAYVGRGTLHRANQHRTRSFWFEDGMFLRILYARNEWHSMRLEGLWGELFRPRYNKDGYRR